MASFAVAVFAGFSPSFVAVCSVFKFKSIIAAEGAEIVDDEEWEELLCSLKI